MKILLACLAFLLCCPMSFAFSADYFVTIGGGPDPHSNQVSLESNVLFSQRVLATAGVALEQQQVFFADGNVANPDLQYQDTEVESSDAELWMMRIFGDESALQYRYRDHNIPNVTGPAKKAFVKQSFDLLAAKLKANDRLILYVTAHGSGASQDEYDYYSDELADVNEHDTTISLWDDEELQVSELDAWLNKFSPDVHVILIMAQCHSGGFANSIFHHADAKRGLHPSLRIGFFSQRHDRAAAGCTPEIDEHEYREYSTYFWQAIGGVTRDGQNVDLPDYDHDGSVSLAEAHAYAVIQSETIDIPISTSDAFLRKFSRFAAIDKSDSKSSEDTGGGLLGALFGSKKPKKDSGIADGSHPMGRDQTIADIQKMARPEQIAIIKKLSIDTKAKPTDSISRLRRRAKKLELAVDKLTQLWTGAYAIASSERDLLADNLSLQWPALEKYSVSVQMMRLMNKDGEEFVKHVESLPGCDSVLQSQKRSDELEKKTYKVIHKEAAMRRLIRTCENVILEKNLPHYATESQRKHFQRMSELERESLVHKRQRLSISDTVHKRHSPVATQSTAKSGD